MDKRRAFSHDIPPKFCASGPATELDALEEGGLLHITRRDDERLFAAALKRDHSPGLKE
jgi:hypothetical protein